MQRFRSLLLFSLMVSVMSWTNAEALDRTKPLEVEADSMTLDMKTKTTTWKGNVIARQGTLSIKGNTMSGHQDESGFLTYTGTGSLLYFKQKIEGKADYTEGWAECLDYSSQTGMVVLTGNAKLKNINDTLIGHSITYDIVNQSYFVTSVGDKKRVRAIIYPENSSPSNP